MENIDLKKGIDIVLECIRDYEDGNQEREEEVIDIIRAIYKYHKYAKKSQIRTKFVILYNHLLTMMTNPGLTQTEEYQTLKKLSESDLEYYKEVSKKLHDYILLGLETDSFPDLEAAYLLTVSLSDILISIIEYLTEIVRLSKQDFIGYEYTSNSRAIENGKKRKLTVSNLVSIISKGE